MELSDKQMATVVLALTSTVDSLTDRVKYLEQDLKWAEKDYLERADKVEGLETDVAFYKNEAASLRQTNYTLRDELYAERNKVWKASVDAQFQLLNVKEIRDSIFSNVDGFKKAVAFWRDNQKINAIKIIRETTGLGLKEAKDLCEKFCPMVCEEQKPMDPNLGTIGD